MPLYLLNIINKIYPIAMLISFIINKTLNIECFILYLNTKFYVFSSNDPLIIFIKQKPKYVSHVVTLFFFILPKKRLQKHTKILRKFAFLFSLLENLVLAHNLTGTLYQISLLWFPTQIRTGLALLTSRN